MLKIKLITTVLAICCFSLLCAEDLNIDVTINSVHKTLTHAQYLQNSTQKFELKNEMYPLLSFTQLCKLYKVKKCTAIECSSKEGMKVSVAVKEFTKSGILLFNDKKESYYRLVIKDDVYKTRWIKYITKIEFK